jgi:chromosome partitioning protein
MRIVTMASQKGEAGKTTLASHLAVEVEHMGAGPVAVVDTGPQGSLAPWWNSREAPTPLLVSAAIPQRLQQRTPQMAEHCRSAVHNSGSMSI